VLTVRKVIPAFDLCFGTSDGKLGLFDPESSLTRMNYPWAGPDCSG
jgi:hypothetical protein